MEILFFISIAVVAWTYLGYVGVITLWGTLLPRWVERRYQSVSVSVVVAARDEEINIRARIDNLREQDYPAELVEIIVVSDGSTDRTAEIAREFGDGRVQVVELDAPLGKAAALNHGVEMARGDIIVFADARQRFDPNVIAELTAMFYDESVGAVSGELMIEPGVDSQVNEGVGMYWRYEKLIRRMESAVDSVVGATGSIYAVRRSLFRPIEEDALLDDVLVPMRIVLDGYRVLFERRARAYDITSATATQEFRRKVRTLAGNFQALVLEPRLLDPRRNRIFFQLVSHKLARLVVPYFFLVALVSSAFADGLFYRIAFWCQIAALAAGLLHHTPLRRSRVGKLVRMSWMFTVLNAAAVTALWVFLTGRERTVWKKSWGPTDRPAAPGSGG